MFTGGQNASLKYFLAALDHSLAGFFGVWGQVFQVSAMPVKSVKSSAPANEFEGHAAAKSSVWRFRCRSALADGRLA